MKINILQLLEGARKAEGLTVVIDVFRAFSLGPYAFSKGVEKIIPVADLDLAFRLKKEHPDYILVGERDEQKVPGFDFGNSPTHLLESDLKGKTIVHSTSSGTQGLANAVNAGEILTGSFVHADAIVKYIRKQNPDMVSLVCMGYATEYPIEEDTFCAEYIRDRLENKKPDFEEMVKIMRKTSGARFFEKEKQSFAPSSDFELCTALNRFDFIVKAKQGDEFMVLKQYSV